MLINPAASRTLDPSGRSLVSVVGIHDKRLADSELNLIQSLGDFKRHQVLRDQVCSGALTYAPFSFSARSATPQALTFTCPAFDALVNGDVVTIGGANSALLSSNHISVPSPNFWTPGSTAPQAAVLVVFVELWYARLNSATGQGYAVNSISGVKYFFPNGCTQAMSANLIPNDAVDPFQGAPSSERVQLQWALRVVSIDPSYDFTQTAFGLDAGLTAAATVFGQGPQSSPATTSPYAFTNLASVNGDAGLWRSGDGNAQNALGTLDGYTYALPIAVLFQRNSGLYTPDTNPFGTADAHVAGSGLLASGWTSRIDGKFADVVFPEDVVDTRSVVSLTGWDNDKLLREGFVDVIAGAARVALARGETPGNLPIAVGSLLDYTVSVGPASVANTDSLGAWDGYRNGFSAADQTFYSTQIQTVNGKSSGTVGGPWSEGDSFTITLPPTTDATIEYLQVQALVDDTVNAIKTPVLLLAGQIAVSGLGTKAVTVQMVKNLARTSYDPGLNPMSVTLGVEYPANTGMDLRKIPSSVWGGEMVDAVAGKTLPVFGVSDYAVQANLPTVGSGAAKAFNPNYSNLIFGTRVTMSVAGSTGVATTTQSGNPITTFTVPRTSLPGNLTGLYVVSMTDATTGAAYVLVGRTISSTAVALQIQGSVASSATLVATFLAADTAQLSFSAPVKAVTAIEETVLAGTVSDSGLRADPRIAVVSVRNYPGDHNAVVLGTTGAELTGIAGDDVNKLVWVRNTNGSYDAVQIASAVFSNGFVTLTVPPTVNLEVQAFFVVCALNPAFSPNSTLTLIESYVPYQGEGRVGRDYEIVHTENSALVTTNGTGTAPVPGLKDIYPYNRELPIATTLPSQVSWSDQTLLNQPVTGLFDSNFVAKANGNVEHTFEVPAHANDFIEPISDGKRKSFQLSTQSGARGYAKAIPHMGFAISPVSPRTAIGTNVTMTSGAITLYVNNVSGDDGNDGATSSTPFRTIAAALGSLPSVLQHPCSVQLMATGAAYSVAANSTSLETVALGDGQIRSAKYYALGILCFTIQGSGRLVVTAMAGDTGVVTIDATGFAGFGDGPTSAFFIESSRVIFNRIEFRGFSDPAIKGLDANVEFINCAFTRNNQAASFEQASSVVFGGGTVTLGDAQTGFVLNQSELGVSGVTLAVSPGAVPGTFFVAGRQSSLTLDQHLPSDETNITSAVLVASADLNSSIEVTPAFSTAGGASISQNSVLSRTVAVTPFAHVLTDVSSCISTSVA